MGLRPSSAIRASRCRDALPDSLRLRAPSERPLANDVVTSTVQTPSTNFTCSNASFSRGGSRCPCDAPTLWEQQLYIAFASGFICAWSIPAHEQVVQPLLRPECGPTIRACRRVASYHGDNCPTRYRSRRGGELTPQSFVVPSSLLHGVRCAFRIRIQR